MSDDEHRGVPHPRNDNRPPADAAAFGQAVLYEIVGGLRFYSRLPIGFAPHLPPELTRLASVLPLVSLLLGIAPAVLLVILIWCGLPSVYAAGIAVAAGLVLTGAMVPYAFGSSDGLFNLGSALSFVQVLPPGVYVAMNGKCFPWNRVRKNRDRGEFEEVR